MVVYHFCSCIVLCNCANLKILHRPDLNIIILFHMKMSMAT